MAANQNNHKMDTIIGTTIAGCAVLGVGIGMLNEELAVGALIGAGVGLLLAATIRAFVR